MVCFYLHDFLAPFWHQIHHIPYQPYLHGASVPSALYIAKLFFHKIPYRAILKRNGGGNYGKTKNLYYQAQQ